MSERPIAKDKRIEKHKEAKKKTKELKKEANRRAIATYYAGSNPND